jgi:predicted Zn-dependent protease with MMP-like domain
MAELSTSQFKILVDKAIRDLPSHIKNNLKNIQIAVTKSPSTEQLLGSGLENKLDLVSLYEGIPLAYRYGYEKILPDKITLFQESFESICLTEPLDHLSIPRSSGFSDIEENFIREIKDTITLELSRHLELPQD